ncbi:protease inhibitor I42 family protein [Candidatus Saccharibacteria bacterium]|nr:protease inhibitor I42 family protein [Candidatus Saccharibacteria bacterium]
MKKKVIVGIIIAGVVAIGAAATAIIISKVNQNNSAEPKDIATITMNAIAGTPYFWSYKTEDNNVVELVEEKSTAEESGLVGAPYQLIYKFKGINPGETKITYDYASVADGYISERVIYKITVAEDHTTTAEVIDRAYGLDPSDASEIEPAQEAQDIEPGIEE